jgi:hypothetical protein
LDLELSRKITNLELVKKVFEHQIETGKPMVLVLDRVEEETL